MFNKVFGDQSPRFFFFFTLAKGLGSMRKSPHAWEDGSIHGNQTLYVSMRDKVVNQLNDPWFSIPRVES